jgi:hypothetical protein
MAKVRLKGAVNLSFDVRYGLTEDLEIKVHAIPVEIDGKTYKVLVGEGDISHIPERTLRFIGERLESLLRKDKTLVSVDGFGEFFIYGSLGSFNDHMLSKALFKTEFGKLLLKAYKSRDASALQEVVRRNLWFMSESGMREFVAWKKALKKAQEKDIPFSIVQKARDLI